MAWRLIETAPRGGTTIFVTGLDRGGHRYYMIAYWWRGKFYSNDGIHLKHLTHWKEIISPEEEVKRTNKHYWPED